MCLTAEENEDYWNMFNDFSDETEDYYQAQYARLREKMNIKNKYNEPGQEHYFGNYKYEATQWNEPMLTKMHKTIRLDGKPNMKVTKDQ